MLHVVAVALVLPVTFILTSNGLEKLNPIEDDEESMLRSGF